MVQWSGKKPRTRHQLAIWFHDTICMPTDDATREERLRESWGLDDEESWVDDDEELAPG